MKQAVKATFLLLCSAFLTFRSVELVRQVLASKSGDLSTSEELIVGLLLTIFVTGIFALPGFALPTSRLLPNRYYQIKHPKVLLIWYKRLNVELFRKFLLVTFWAGTQNRKRYFDGTRAGFDNLIFQSKQSESGHLMPLIIIQIVAIAALAKGFTYIFVIATFINIIGNFYPIPLQRMHRYRIMRLSQRSMKSAAH